MDYYIDRLHCGCINLAVCQSRCLGDRLYVLHRGVVEGCVSASMLHATPIVPQHGGTINRLAAYQANILAPQHDRNLVSVTAVDATREAS